MFDAQVVDYIKKALVAGQTMEQIKTALIQNGWTEQEINDNILAANGSQASVVQPQPLPQQPQIQPEPQQPQQTQPSQPEPSFQQPQAQPEPQIQPDSQIQQPISQPEPIDIQINSGLGMKQGPASTQPEFTPDFNPDAGKPDQDQLRQGESIYQFQHQQKPRPEDRKQGKLLKFMISFAVIIMFLAIGGAAFVYFNPLQYINSLISSPVVEIQTNTQTQETQQTQTTFESYLENTSFSAKLPDYTITLNELSNLSNFEKTLGASFTDNQKTSLVNNNFFIAANYDTSFYSTDTTATVERNDDWTGLYKTIGGSSSKSERQPDNAVFISTDYLTHVYHKLVEQEFSYIEELKLYPVLKTLSNSMLASASSSTSTDTAQQESYNRLAAYFLVSSAILNNAEADYATLSASNFITDTATDTKANALTLVNSLATQYKISEEVQNLAKEEISLIFDAAKYSSSPLLGKYQANTLEDYTQYSPRSHYSKNVILRDYFRAMIWFGRMNFLVSSKELTRDAANMTLLMTDEQIQQWKSIYEPTSFFVGQADDLTIEDIKKAITATGFSQADESDEMIATLQAKLATYSNPTIMSSAIVSESVSSTSKEDLLNSTKGFRFMGQRSTPDAFIFSSLTQGDEAADTETGQKLPSTPTALMVSTLMGDVVSKDYLNTWIANNASSSDKVLANKINELQSFFGGTTTEQWTQNLYWSWIYTIKSLFNSEADKTGYPMFMKNSDWNTKSTQSFLGSWTELKHDTLLYAKQSYAEMGAGGGEEIETATPKGYVEPNIEFFDRLIALVKTTNSGLTQYGLMPEIFQSRNNSYIESLEFLKRIAVSELANQTITDDDFEQLRINAYSLDQLLEAPDSQEQLESNARSALIADVHTDTVKSQILYEADGIPNYIYVAVKDANGTRLTKGLVYSYYEFTNPSSKRLDDATWQKWNYSSTIKLLKMPDWNKALIK